MANNNLTIDGITDSIAYCEAMGLAKTFAAYAVYASGEGIEVVGFNANSGYVYIALDNGVQICSMLGQDVEYLVSNPFDGEEIFLDSYDEALAHEWEEEEEEEEEEEVSPCAASWAMQHCPEMVHAWVHEQKVKLEELAK